MFIFERSSVFSMLVLATIALGAGCGEDEPTPGGALEPPPEGQGFQLSMVATIAASQETESCRFVTSPAEETWVSGDQVEFTQGSHHFLLYETTYTSIPTMNERREVVDTSGVFFCGTAAT